jgi:ADP-L-glycero-D-manno-heptose 6-epimerase
VIAVTGGAGFIGRHLVGALGAAEDVLVIERAPGDVMPVSSSRVADVLDADEFERTFATLARRLRAVVHLGAVTDTLRADADVMETNFGWSRRLLDRCQDHGVRLVYASSAAVYGDGQRGFVEEPRCEGALNLYARSKLLLDAYARARGALRPAGGVAGLRYFNVYGPGEGRKGRMASMISQLIAQARAEGEMRLFAGSEGFRRDFVYVDDVVRVTRFFVERPELSGIYNCGTGRAESFLAVAEAVQAHHPRASIRLIPFPEEIRPRYQTYTCADLERLRRAGYGHAFVSLADGVAACVGAASEPASGPPQPAAPHR